MVDVRFDIVEDFLSGRTVDPSAHWVFDRIEEGKTLFEWPSSGKADVEALYLLLKAADIGKLLVNQGLVRRVYGNLESDYSTTVNFIVGSPAPYDAFVREDSGRSEVFIDLFRLLAYGIPPARCVELSGRFITHELIHVANRDALAHRADSQRGKLLWIAFDEGMAHYLSFERAPASVDWNCDEFRVRREKAGRRFLEVLEADAISSGELEEGCTGPYWDKYAAIHGMFLVADIIGRMQGDEVTLRNVADRWLSLARPGGGSDLEISLRR